MNTPHQGKPNTYTAQLLCNNCAHCFDRDYDYGEEVPVIEQCPHCGCHTAWKAPYELQVSRSEPRGRSVQN